MILASLCSDYRTHLISDVLAEVLPAFGLAVVSHARLDVFFGGRQPAIGWVRWRGIVGVVHASRRELDGRPARVLNADVGGEDPQIGIRDGGKLALDRLEEGACRIQPSVLGIVCLLVEAHPGTIGPTCARCLVKGATAMPRQADEGGRERAVVPRRIVHARLELGAHCSIVHQRGGRLLAEKLRDVSNRIRRAGGDGSIHSGRQLLLEIMRLSIVLHFRLGFGRRHLRIRVCGGCDFSRCSDEKWTQSKALGGDRSSNDHDGTVREAFRTSNANHPPTPILYGPPDLVRPGSVAGADEESSWL